MSGPDCSQQAKSDPQSWLQLKFKAVHYGGGKIRRHKETMRHNTRRKEKYRKKNETVLKRRNVRSR
jgi:hypothetical protein